MTSNWRARRSDGAALTTAANSSLAASSRQHPNENGLQSVRDWPRERGDNGEWHRRIAPAVHRLPPGSRWHPPGWVLVAVLPDKHRGLRPGRRAVGVPHRGRSETVRLAEPSGPQPLQETDSRGPAEIQPEELSLLSQKQRPVFLVRRHRRNPVWPFSNRQRNALTCSRIKPTRLIPSGLQLQRHIST